MRGVLCRRLIHLFSVVILIHLAGQSGSALPYRLPWQVRHGTSLDCSVCAWVCCNPRIAHRDRRSLLLFRLLGSFSRCLECSGARATSFAFTCHAFFAACFDPIALGFYVGVKAGFPSHHFFLRVLPASDNAIAIACLRLLTLGPLPGPGLPLCSVPRLYSPITLATLAWDFVGFFMPSVYRPIAAAQLR